MISSIQSFSKLSFAGSGNSFNEQQSGFNNGVFVSYNSYSSDGGQTWQNFTVPGGLSASEVFVVDGRFIKLYSNGVGTYTRIFYSTDGANWTAHPTFSSDRGPSSITFAYGLWRGMDGNGYYYTANTLEGTWTRVLNGTYRINGDLPGEDKFLHFKDNVYKLSALGGKIYRTTDFVSWTTNSLTGASLTPLVDIATDGNILVAVGWYGKKYWTTDGITWNTMPVETAKVNASYKGIVYHNNVWVLTPGDGERPVEYSTNGINWQDLDLVLQSGARAAVAGGGVILLLGTTVSGETASEYARILPQPEETFLLDNFNGNTYLDDRDVDFPLSSRWTITNQGGTLQPNGFVLDGSGQLMGAGANTFFRFDTRKEIASSTFSIDLSNASGSWPINVLSIQLQPSNAPYFGSVSVVPPFGFYIFVSGGNINLRADSGFLGQNTQVVRPIPANGVSCNLTISIREGVQTYSWRDEVIHTTYARNVPNIGAVSVYVFGGTETLRFQGVSLKGFGEKVRNNNFYDNYSRDADTNVFGTFPGTLKPFNISTEDYWNQISADTGTFAESIIFSDKGYLAAGQINNDSRSAYVLKNQAGNPTAYRSVDAELTFYVGDSIPYTNSYLVQFGARTPSNITNIEMRLAKDVTTGQCQILLIFIAGYYAVTTEFIQLGINAVQPNNKYTLGYETSGGSQRFYFNEKLIRETFSTADIQFTNIEHQVIRNSASQIFIQDVSATIANRVLQLPQIYYFNASTENVPLGGGRVTFNFNVTPGATASIDNGVGDVTGFYQATVNVTAPTTYTLTATNADGSVTSSRSIGVFTQPPSKITTTATTFFLDNFNNNNSKDFDLSTHLPDIGNGWEAPAFDWYPSLPPIENGVVKFRGYRGYIGAIGEAAMPNSLADMFYEVDVSFTVLGEGSEVDIHDDDIVPTASGNGLGSYIYENLDTPGQSFWEFGMYAYSADGNDYLFDVYQITNIPIVANQVYKIRIELREGRRRALGYIDNQLVVDSGSIASGLSSVPAIQPALYVYDNLANTFLVHRFEVSYATPVTLNEPTRPLVRTSYFMQDTFTGSAGDTLATHVGEVDAVWSAVDNNGLPSLPLTNLAIDNNGRLALSDATLRTNGFVQFSGNPVGTNDIYYETTVYPNLLRPAQGGFEIDINLSEDATVPYGNGMVMAFVYSDHEFYEAGLSLYFGDFPNQVNSYDRVYTTISCTDNAPLKIRLELRENRTRAIYYLNGSVISDTGTLQVPVPPINSNGLFLSLYVADETVDTVEIDYIEGSYGSNAPPEPAPPSLTIGTTRTYQNKFRGTLDELRIIVGSPINVNTLQLAPWPNEFAGTGGTGDILGSDEAWVDITATKNGVALIPKRFSLTRARRGVDGTNGVGIDGTNKYIHFKYSNDGGLNFTPDTGNGLGEDPGKYLGTLVDETLADSTLPSAYSWALIKGEDGLVGTLTNESVVLAADKFGVVADYSVGSGFFRVLLGLNDITTGNGIIYSVFSESGVDVSINASTGAYVVNSMGSNTGTAVFRAAVPNGASTVNIDKVFSIAKAVEGQPGNPAKLIYLSVNSQVFSVSSTGSVSPASIIFTSTPTALTGTPEFNVIAGTATLSGTGNTRTLTYANMTSDLVTVQVSQDGVSDTISVIKVRNGSDAINVLLSNESHIVPATYLGDVTSFSGASSSIALFRGATDETSSWTVSRSDNGLTTTLSGYTVTVTGMSAGVDVGYSDITLSRTGYTSITKRFTVTKSKAGEEGAVGSASLLYLSATSQVFIVSKDGSTSPASIVLTAYDTNLTGSAVFEVIAGSASLSGTGNTRTLTAANILTDLVTIRATQDGYTDTITIVRVRDGTDSISVFLSNQSHIVPASSGGVVTDFSGASTSIIVYRGSTLDTTNWTISKADNSVTTALSGYTVTATAMAANKDTGFTTITLSRAGFTSLTQQFTITKSKAGIDGQSDGRGNINIAVETTGSVWSDATAEAAILAAGYTAVQSRDIVTLYNPTTGFTETRFYSGGTWLIATSYINGNLIVDGTIGADKIEAGVIGAATSLTVGTTPAVSGSTMTGSGGVINSTGTFALGNERRNISFDGNTLSLNGDVVANGNIALGAVGTLSIAGEAITVPRFYIANDIAIVPVAGAELITATFNTAGGGFIGSLVFTAAPINVDAWGTVEIYVAGTLNTSQKFGIRVNGADAEYQMTVSVPFAGTAAGSVTILAKVYSGKSTNINKISATDVSLSIMSGKR